MANYSSLKGYFGKSIQNHKSEKKMVWIENYGMERLYFIMKVKLTSARLHSYSQPFSIT